MKKLFWLSIFVITLYLTPIFESKVYSAETYKQNEVLMLIYDPKVVLSFDVKLLSLTDWFRLAPGNRLQSDNFMDPNKLLKEGWRLFQVVPGGQLQYWIFVK